MNQKNVKVLHIDSEKGWRSSQQQTGTLLEHMFRMGYQTALVCHPRSAFRNFAKRHKLPHYSVEINGQFDLIAGLHIALLAVKHHYKILHLHSANALSIGLWAKLFHPRLKLVATRNVNFHLHHSKLRRYKYDNSLLDKIVCMSDRIRRVLTEDKIPSSKLITIRSGIDLLKFDNVNPPANFREQLGISPNNLIIGTVAALESHKDYPTFIRAAKLVVSQRRDVTFIAVGDGQQKRILEVMVRSMGLTKNFIFAGFRDDVGNFLKTFDIYVMASNLDSMGTSMLDAQAVGLPVISAQKSGISEIIIHEQNGLLFPQNSEKDLASMILQLCDNPDLRHRIAENGKQTVQQFSIEKIVEKYIQLYEELL
jgi:L-malate glycosyltransferase